MPTTPIIATIIGALILICNTIYQEIMFKNTQWHDVVLLIACLFIQFWTLGALINGSWWPREEE